MAWPTTDDPRTQFVTLRLTSQEFAQLDTWALAQGLSRSAAVRALLDKKVFAPAPKTRKTRKGGTD